MFKKKNNLLNIPAIIILLVVVFYILYIWASLIIPFIIALLFSFAIIWLSNFYKKLKLWKFISFILSISTYVFLFYLVWRMIGSNVEEVIRLLPEYQSKIWEILKWIFEFFHIPEPKSLNEILSKINLQYIFTNTISAITSIFSSAWIILVYVMFILLEYRYFRDKLSLILTEKWDKSEVLWIIEKIKTDTKSYFVIKTVVSFITAWLSYIFMLLFGLDFAIFWAFLVFFLNYIPSIWSIIAVAFPAFLSLIQFESYYTFLLLSSSLIWVQIFMWNIIEPKFLWNKLNLSPLTIILALWFWGSLWWVVGMLLSVPIMIIINIILAKIPATRPIAILLSEKWELQTDWGEEVVKTRKKFLKKILRKFVKK
jgi:predicted PurR-regulated permease PerM